MLGGCIHFSEVWLNFTKNMVGFRQRERANHLPLFLFIQFSSLPISKETTLQRADFKLQLLMFVTAEKERAKFIIFFLSFFNQLLSPPVLSKSAF